VIPEDSVVHETVFEKLNLDPDYKPPNLPQNPNTEPRNPCSFLEAKRPGS